VAPTWELFGWGNYWKAKFQNMSLLFGFSGIELERKIKSFIVSFHNFGRPNLEHRLMYIIKYFNLSN
jgi:hypothetical protein